MDAISTARLQTVIPELARRVTRLDSLLLTSQLCVHIRVVQALRSYADQAALYAQGRTLPGKIVTDARPMDSMHIYGLAVDACPDLPGLPTWQPDWNENDARWKEFLSIAQTCNLAEGAQWRTFNDFPHLYLGELPADPDDNLKELLTDGGVQAVWDWCNKTYQFAP